MNIEEKETVSATSKYIEFLNKSRCNYFKNSWKTYKEALQILKYLPQI